MIPKRQNLFEGEIGSGPVAPKKGALALMTPESVKFFEKIRKDLKNAEVTEHKVVVEGMSLKDLRVVLIVCIKFQDSETESKWPFHHKRETDAQLIDLGFSTEIREFCDKIGTEVNRSGKLRIGTGGVRTWEPDQIQRGDFIDIRTQVMEKLEADCNAANTRLKREIKKLKLSDDVQLAGQNAYNSKIRDFFHASIKKYRSIDPEILHKYLDEFFVNEIHDS
jgi:hypothetical protein